jgi:hypothetical protein
MTPTELSYKSAKKRKTLSPVGNLLLESQLLTKTHSYLDYGCGYGFDWQYFRDHGWKSQGYDPYYFPMQPFPADVVTCCYVLNFIEHHQARMEILQNAWQLTNKRLIIAVINGTNAPEGITQWGTYFKPFSQITIRALIDVSLGKVCRPLGNGIFLVEHSSPSCTPLSHEAVEQQITEIHNSGWIAPIGAYLQTYSPYQSPRSYYRLCHPQGQLPQGKKRIHIPNQEHPSYSWATQGIQRRDKILQLKFHCKDFSYLPEFYNMTQLKFLA